MSEVRKIDLNTDVGEGLNNEQDLFPFISSCSIACGGHAGDEQTMKRVVALALKNNVRIGAHPSYPDRENFGRKSIKLARPDLISNVREQIESLLQILEEANAPLHHIKPHGALYNDLAKDKELAQCFMEAVRPYRNGIKLYVPYGSVIAEEAIASGWPVFYEAFGDRNYNDDLSLVSRSRPEALIQNPQSVLQHILPIIREGRLTTITGNKKAIKAETICLHGDTDNVLEILTYLAREFPKNNLLIA
ncbi:MAG: 5-oxoprolinase subunit PxpA [Eudoraea sp.]|nr:5-oxoprolinase subunit PxpA [Eudoraea sp.]MBT8211245.1 5-oxoprolinase subunit PxpA [Eudoraea sp.]NNK30064.1 5-oxoprolinase subunit PxpA [Flavobacteriaceae bacterium]